MKPKVKSLWKGYMKNIEDDILTVSIERNNNKAS
jgi:hypothetical protein